MSKPFVHSYSAGKMFDQCPHRFHQDRVLRRFPFVQGPEAAEGDRIHNALAENIGDGVPLPEQYRWLKLIADAAARRPGTRLVEQKWALTKAFEPTGYFDGDAYYRYRNDYACISPDGKSAALVDWKSGKDKYPDVEQLVEGAVVLMQHYPEITTVGSALVFVKTGKVVPERYSRSSLDSYIETMAAKYAAIDAALAGGVFPKKPSALCPWCPVEECEFWKPKPEKKR